MKSKLIILSLGLVALTALAGLTPAPVAAQVDVTVAGSSASDNFNDAAIEDMCGGPGNFTRKTRTGSTGNNCPAGTNSQIRSYECNLRFCVGGSRNGLACSGPGDTCPGGTCDATLVPATIRLSGFGSEYGVGPINGDCVDGSADFLCQDSRVRVLDPGTCNVNGGGNNDCACLDPVVGNPVSEEDLGVSDVQGGSFINPVPQPGNSASPVAVPFKYIVNASLTVGICDAVGNANNARNCDTDADCGGAVGSCVDTKLPRLSVAEAQSIWAAGVAQWSQICWNPDTYTCSGGTNLAQPCDPNVNPVTECPIGGDTFQPSCVSCTAFGPERPVTVFPRTNTSGTRACQTQVVHANNGLPFVGGAGNNVDVLYPANVLGIDVGQAGCSDNEVTLTTYPYTTSPGSDGLCDECPDLDGDALCDIRFREGTSTGDVVADVSAVEYSIGYIGADRWNPTDYYGVGYDKALHSVDAMRNGASALWCALTYNKRPDNTYDTNTLKTINSIIDRVNTAEIIAESKPLYSTEADMKVKKNLDRGPIIFK